MSKKNMALLVFTGVYSISFKIVCVHLNYIQHKLWGLKIYFSLRRVGIEA